MWILGNTLIALFVGLSFNYWHLSLSSVANPPHAIGEPWTLFQSIRRSWHEPLQNLTLAQRHVFGHIRKNAGNTRPALSLVNMGPTAPSLPADSALLELQTLPWQFPQTQAQSRIGHRLGSVSNLSSQVSRWLWWNSPASLSVYNMLLCCFHCTNTAHAHLLMKTSKLEEF